MQLQEEEGARLATLKGNPQAASEELEEERKETFFYLLEGRESNLPAEDIRGISLQSSKPPLRSKCFLMFLAVWSISTVMSEATCVLRLDKYGGWRKKGMKNHAEYGTVTLHSIYTSRPTPIKMEVF